MSSLIDNRQISTRQERELAIAKKGKRSEGLSFTSFADTWGAYYSAECLYMQTTTQVQKDLRNVLRALSVILTLGFGDGAGNRSTCIRRATK